MLDLIFYFFNMKIDKTHNDIHAFCPVINKEMAVKLAVQYIKENNIEVLDINNPSVGNGDNQDYWAIDFRIEQEPMRLPPFITVLINKNTGNDIHMGPRL
jgi:hypothetical protein